jgi:Flp pilus assembly protein TadG
MRIRSQTARRPAASMVETGIVMLTFLVAVVGMIDLGVAVYRQHVISEAARYGARLAAVHGQYCATTTPSWNGGGWGSTQIGPTAASTTGTPIIDSMRTNFLQGTVDLSNTNITVQWPDGNNNVESRVEVTVTTTYTPMLTLIFSGSFTMTANSTMQIAH